MLAMEAGTPLGVRLPALSLATIASVLAPTGVGYIILWWAHSQSATHTAARSR